MGELDDPAVVPTWYDIMSEVAGTVTVDGTPYTFVAHGIREHMTVGRETNNINNNAPYDPIYWNWLINRGFAVCIFRYPDPGLISASSVSMARTLPMNRIRSHIPWWTIGPTVEAGYPFPANGTWSSPLTEARSSSTSPLTGGHSSHGCRCWEYGWRSGCCARPAASSTTQMGTSR